MIDPWHDVTAAGTWLLQLVEQLRPDVIHLNAYVHGALPWSVPALVVADSCVLSWWEAVRGEDAPPEWSRYRAEVASGLQGADMVVAPTRAMVQSLERHYGRMAVTRVIPNGRDAALFRPGPKSPQVFAAGRLWDEAKNIATLDQVAPELPWPIYVAGEQQHPEGGQACHAHVNQLGRLSRPELADWLGRSAIYALPARYEPFGLSVLEAALAGCALVLGDIPSLREIWGDAALYVAPESPDELAVVLQKLIGDDRLRASLAAQAQNRAALLTPSAMVAAYLDTYVSLSTVAALGRTR